MSVIKSKRGESEMEFIYTARQLEIHTIRKCAHFPKKYTFYVSQPLANMATRVHQYVKKANSVYPANQHEAQIRRDFLIRANAELQSMISEIEVAHEIFGLEPKEMTFWMDLVEREIRLVKAVMKKDRERYRNLP